MREYRVTCKVKRAQFERIESIGCIDTTTGSAIRFSEDQAIELIESRTARFVDRDSFGNEASVEVEQREGRKFLITRRDGVVTDNLLWLPDCQPKPAPQPPPRPVTPPRVHGFGLVSVPAGGVDVAALPALLLEHYPQFKEISVPPHIGAERALAGTVQPFDSETEIGKICADLRADRAVDVQAGRLRHRTDCREPHDIVPSDPRMINLFIEFSVLIVQLEGRLHPVAYALRPEVSRQRFPLHPHLRDDLDILWDGRHRQSLCSYFAPDGACGSIIDFIDFTAIFLAKHLMWERTLELIDCATGRVLQSPAPGALIIDKTEPMIGPEYSIHAAPLLRHPGALFQRDQGWRGMWPGSAAPHDAISNLRLPDLAECHCGSGARYADCHQRLDEVIARPKSWLGLIGTRVN